ncbi:MAG: type III-B CRISPR module-associated protein Cmr5 [Candidatus Sumerlaeaceae bacterium]|nr:type III-B CRISPR module-associated protein Cmr5 [Candidatus Sumerlaeaceae bacterium]
MAQTRQQRMAQRAFEQIKSVANRPDTEQKDYARFAKQFPALIHSCGLCQAVAFAQAKDHTDHIRHLAAVMEMNNKNDEFLTTIRQAQTMAYLRLSRIGLQAASWLKRYAEALLKDPDDDSPGKANNG